MPRYGIVRIGLAVPTLKIANCASNVDAMIPLLRQASDTGCDLIAFPELALTGYTCADLFQQSALLDDAARQLARLATEGARAFTGLTIVGLPIRVEGRLYNCAAVLQGGRILGLIPKSFLPNYKEFYEQRWFAPADGHEPSTARIGNTVVPFGTNLLLTANDLPEFVVGVELCEDFWVPIPPSSLQSLAGALVLINLSASNEVIGKSSYRRELVTSQSGRCVAAYGFVSAGPSESTTDLVFGGHALIAENGHVLAEKKPFAAPPALTVADVDLERLVADRAQLTSFGQAAARTDDDYRRIGFTAGPATKRDKSFRVVAAHPFVPAQSATLAERCEEIFRIQTAGLVKRLDAARIAAVQIGISGGLDSTLALLVATKAFDELRRDRKGICALTMPGFGTSDRTLGNAGRLMDLLNVSAAQLDIRQLSLDLYVALGQQPFGINPAGMTVEQFQAALASLPPEKLVDLDFENIQARARTFVLMSRGFVIGTGDLSELALGWCTYNGDHMSMYNPNVSIPKTLVRFLVSWAADHIFDGELRDVLHSVVNTEISPELLPVSAANQIQSTESAIGPYELHDFFLYYMIRFGFGPRKIMHLAGQTKFDKMYSRKDLHRWLSVFYRRFFANQFKRSCLPDGPKVGTISLSPRGDWRMPSDADVSRWLAELEHDS